MTLPAKDASRICALVSGSPEQPRLPRPTLRRMTHFMISAARPALLSLALSAVPLAAQIAAPPARPVPIEAVSAMPVATVLPARLLSGPGWRVSQNAPTDGYSGLYNLETEYGSFGCLGIEMLETRVRELYAIRELDRVSKSSVFLKAAGDAAAKPFEAAANIVRDPVNSIKKAPAGIAGLFERVGKGAQQLGRAASKQAQQLEDRYNRTGSYVPSEQEQASRPVSDPLAASRGRQMWAAKLGVDPYTTNPVLAPKLNQMAMLGFAGGTLTGFGISAVAMPLTITQKVDEYVLTQPPSAVREINTRTLQSLRISPDPATRFLDNGFFTPTLETRFVKAIKGLAGVAGLDNLVSLASGASSEVQARFFCRCAEMLSSYHRNQSPLSSLSIHTPLPVATARNKSIVVAAPVDYLPWSARTARFVNSAPGGFANSAPAGSVPPRRILLSSGPLTAAADAAIRGAGWTVIYAGKP